MSDNTVEPRTYFIPICCLEELTAKIEKLNKRAKKLGATPIGMEVGDKSVRYGIHEMDTIAWVEVVEPHHKPTGQVIEVREVTVTGESPKYDGWTFLATLEPVGEKNIIRSLDDECDLSEYRDRVGECDHCRKDRRRKDTYVVRHDDGRMMMVGKTCLKDFLGHSNPNSLAAWASAMFGLDDLFSGYADSDGFGERSVGSWSLELFLGYVAGYIRAYGWVSGKEAHESLGAKFSTAHEVVDHLATPDAYRNEAWNRVEEKIFPTATSVCNKAAAAIEWAKAIETGNGNDYLDNLQLIAEAGYVTQRLAGYAASMLIAHDRFLDRELERLKKANRPDSHHVGNIKERMTMTVTCERIFTSEGMWGVTGIHKMVDADGNDITWFASGSAEWLDIGNTYVVKATVKEHSEYRDRAQTIVNRVKIMEEVAEEVASVG
jgi:hypothetical protein